MRPSPRKRVNLIGQSGGGKRHAFAGKALGLPVEGLVLAIFLKQ
jgi:hypothetical protein